MQSSTILQFRKLFQGSVLYKRVFFYKNPPISRNESLVAVAFKAIKLKVVDVHDTFSPKLELSCKEHSVNYFSFCYKLDPRP